MGADKLRRARRWAARHGRGWAGWLGLWALWGCAHSAPVVHETPAQAAIFRQLDSGIRVAALPRPTPGAVWVALWLDAGSRDAVVPQVATVAAELAAARVTGGVALVLPDGISVGRLCRREALVACLGELRRALSLRDLTERVVRRERLALVERRRRALAQAPALAPHRLALSALLGASAAAFDPLGEAEHDKATTTSEVNRFLAAHFGARRALVVGAGDIGPDPLIAAVDEAFTGAMPRARAGREERSLAAGAQARVGLGVDVAERDWTTIAMALPPGGPGREQAQRLFQSLRQELGPATPLSLDVLAVRGGTIGLIDHAGASEPVLRALVTVLSEWREVDSGRKPGWHTGERAGGLREAATRVGVRFTSESRSGPGGHLPSKARTAPPVALATLVPGGRADAPQLSDPDAGQRQRTLERLSRILETAASDSAAAAVRGDRDAASARLENGARIVARRRDTDRAVVALRFALGGRFDPPSTHGRAALLASLAANHCDGLSSDAQSLLLAELEAELQPRVTSDSWSLVLDLPAVHLPAGLALLLRCGLSPSPERSHLVDARARLLARLRETGDAQLLRAAAGTLLSPGAPGWVAPLGDARTLPALDPEGLAQAIALSARGPAITLGIVGPFAADRWARRAARRVQQIAGHDAATSNAALVKQPALPDPGPPPVAPFARMVVGLRADGDASGRHGAIAVAMLVAGLLQSVPGVRVVWSDGHADASGAWAAVGLAANPDDSLALARRVRAQLAQVTPELAQATVEALSADLELAETAQQASLVTQAVHLVETTASAWQPPNRAAAIRVARQLAASPLRVKALE